MKTTAWTPTMHAVLDGEATAQETASLEAQLAADPEARAEFDRLEALFVRLSAMEPPYPPEGLVASISTAVGEYSRTDQPFADGGVLGSTARDIGLDDEMTASHAAVRQPSSFSFFWERSMNQQSGTLRTNRKLWVGGGIAAVAAAVAIAFGMGGIPHGDDVNGTIVAAERYRAPQAATGGAQLGDMSVAELLQNDAFLKLVKDPQVQALMVEPDFEPGVRLILDNPDAVRRALAGEADPQQSAAFRALLAHPGATAELIASPEASRAILQHQQASLQFVPEAQRVQAANNAPSALGAPMANGAPSAMSAPAANSAPSALGTPMANSAPSAMGAPMANSAPSAMGAPAANSAPSAALRAPGVSNAPSALGAPMANSAPSAMGAPMANSAPSAMGAPAANSAPSAALRAPGVNNAPSALGAPMANSAPSALGAPAANNAPSALGAPMANSAPSALGAPAANSAPSALRAPGANNAPSALGAPMANSAPSALGAPAANSAPSALRAPGANNAPSALSAPAANSSAQQ